MSLKLYHWRRPSLMRICLATGWLLGAILVCAGLYLGFSGKSIAGEPLIIFGAGWVLGGLTLLVFIFYIDYRDNAPFLG